MSASGAGRRADLSVEEQRELQRLLAGRRELKVHFSMSQVAASLWDYGEDELADHVLTLGDADLEGMQAIAAHFHTPGYPLPVHGARVRLVHLTALAAITYVEGRLRPMARPRRRPQAGRPARFTPRNPDPRTGL
ncbi:hypothetical protein [Cellulomonas septica]|uniref:DUF3263 domain-containing protein n=1 Tax=Cellulomonas septica TaxID=285080 RepID=A0ABX1JZW5_9CELL|nr:hypothetical protein [Cellulomonas septica]NKY39866.1 hypothetical protein [Cellulomonas septica]